MITNICLLLEILSVTCCLHCLYGKKLKLDILEVSFLSVYMIIMAAINYYELPKVYTIVNYPIIFLYCGMRFGFKIKEMLINNILYLAVIGGIQLVIPLPFYYFWDVDVFSEIRLLAINLIAFLFVILILPKCKLHKFSIYLQDKERILFISLLICIAIATYCVISYKKMDLIELNQSVLLFVSITFICILAMQLSKYRVRSKEIETELKMHQLYAESFHSLTENIRRRQHEFDNHINTIYSQHYMYKTYEELVNAQKNYCQVVVKDNQYNKLLTTGNPIVIGFLYGKFVESEKFGVEVSYNINIDDLVVGVPIYKLVEVLGNLINNAIEALQISELDKKLYVMMIEVKGEFEIEIRNRSVVIDHSEMDVFFKKGFSKKGDHRGLGLYNVKSICEEYSLQLFCENRRMDNENWLTFIINNKKEII